LVSTATETRESKDNLFFNSGNCSQNKLSGFQRVFFRRRWKDLWKYLSIPSFDGSKMIDDVAREIKSYEPEKSKFISWVNEVLALHRGSTIIEFRIRFSLLNCSEFQIERWLEMMFAKEVERFELDLKRHLTGNCICSDFYTFPFSGKVEIPISSLYLLCV
jgi:hypothetical protein